MGQTNERAVFGSREGQWLRQGTRITSSWAHLFAHSKQYKNVPRCV